MFLQKHARPINSSPCEQNSGDFFRYMMTPDRIPEFIIPPLGLLEEHRHLGKAKALARAPQEFEVPRNKIKDCNCFPRGSFLTCYSSVEVDVGMDDIPADAVTRAALSLPHLPKIITPYGFVTLGQSPHVTKEEALFFQFDLASSRDPNAKRHLDPQGDHQFHSNGDNLQAASPNVSLGDHCPYQAQVVSRIHFSASNSSSIKNRCGRKLSDPGEAQDRDVSPKSSAFLATSCSSLSLQKPQKTPFQKILKKHSARLRNLEVVKIPSQYPTADTTCHPKDSKTWAMFPNS